MGNKIVVNPAKLETAAAKIDEYAADYKKTYMQLFTEVEAMASNWQGTDNVAYTNQIQGFEDDFQNMYKLMTEYSTFLTNSATSYKTTQSNVESAAKQLTN
jgi:WXG100 family type VII secretion target